MAGETSDYTRYGFSDIKTQFSSENKAQILIKYSLLYNGFYLNSKVSV